MKSNDLTTRRLDCRTAMQKAIQADDHEAFCQAFDDMLAVIADDVRSQYETQINGLSAELDARILTARGVRQLTSEEREYYQKFAAAALSSDPKQAVSNLDAILPKTTVNSVMDDLSTAHPLLSKINFVPTGGAVELVMNTNGYQEAAWGSLCDDIVKELTAGFRTVNTTLLKLSAFIPVCRAMLDLGPEYLDNYVRQVLYEAAANGLEAGIVSGDGKDKPIGMTRQVGDEVSVSGGVYPEKSAVPVTDFLPTTIGGLLANLAVDEHGKYRRTDNVLLICNPVDYLQKVMPATTLLAPDGTYRKDVLPYPMTVIPSPALPEGRAVLGLGNRYFAALGTAKSGKIEYSDHYRFLEDERVYTVRMYAQGMPMDNNAFTLLDISGLQPINWRVEQVEVA